MGSECKYIEVMHDKYGETTRNQTIRVTKTIKKKYEKNTKRISLNKTLYFIQFLLDPLSPCIFETSRSRVPGRRGQCF